MTESLREIARSDIASPERFLRDIVEPCRPVIIRGLVSDWPAVAAARSPTAFRDYAARFDCGARAEAFFGPRNIAGKYYYSDDFKGFNFERRTMRFSDALETVASMLDQPDSPTVYIGSLPVEDYLPGFSAQNAAPFLNPTIEARIWVGHASNVSSHYDAFDNLACVVAGERRFTLFAPELIGRLYVGEIDNTMAGQPVSLAASLPLDDERFPLFQGIKDRALRAELLAGDALYLPKLWWHQVEATAPFNILVNFWWDAFRAGPDAPHTSMLLAMITICERPAPERAAWKALFDHYVFRTNGHPLAHLPADRHGVLGPLKENYGKIRARVMRALRGG